MPPARADAGEQLHVQTPARRPAERALQSLTLKRPHQHMRQWSRRGGTGPGEWAPRSPTAQPAARSSRRSSTSSPDPPQETRPAQNAQIDEGVSNACRAARWAGNTIAVARSSPQQDRLQTTSSPEPRGRAVRGLQRLDYSANGRDPDQRLRPAARVRTTTTAPGASTKGSWSGLALQQRCSGAPARAAASSPRRTGTFCDAPTRLRRSPGMTSTILTGMRLPGVGKRALSGGFVAAWQRDRHDQRSTAQILRRRH